MKSKDKDSSVSSKTMMWWRVSVPYSICYLLAIWCLEAFGISGGAIGHSGIILPFLGLALLTSLLSLIWFLAMIYRLFFTTSNVQMNIGNSLLIALSAIAGAWSVFYLAKG